MLVAFVVSACSRTPEPPLTPALVPAARAGQLVHASYYGGARWSGKTTASGEKFNPHDLTAAHRTLPFGTKVKVTNPESGKSVVVRINDRGPFIKGRSIDLSQQAARELGIESRGVSEVEMLVLDEKTEVRR
ncbi:MAG: septal ring lytic transglycosylase RlpA family protein [Deltaproteobacteria bacterium]|nr:septal ring lytic transglycosylase RlpA family protein [Deltaproteobacteria bacterium]